jgi:hypothetical protein
MAIGQVLGNSNSRQLVASRILRPGQLAVLGATTRTTAVTVITIPGSSLQAAHDRAQAGDVLAPRAGTYAGLRITKVLTVEGGGGLIIEGPGNTVEFTPTAAGSALRGATVRGSTGPTNACLLIRAPQVLVEDVAVEDGSCYGVRQYLADALTMRRVSISRVAAGVEVHRCGAGSVAEDVVISDVDRMVVDSPGGNGGDAWQFVASTGPYRLLRPKVARARAKTVAPWGWDGGAFQGYGPCGAVVIEDWEVRDSVNVCEVGTDAAMGGVPTGWVFRNGDAWGISEIVPLTHERACVGFTLRANIGFLIERNRFHSLDWWVFSLVAGGAYAGPTSGNVFRDNDVWIKPDAPEARYVVVGAGVDASAYSIDGNRVHLDPARTPGGVASVAGMEAIRDIATFQAQTPWGAADTWDNASDDGGSVATTRTAT